MAGGAVTQAGLALPPQFIESYAYAANALARIICRTGTSRAAFIAHCYQDALAITEEHKLVVLALAQALIDHRAHAQRRLDRRCDLADARTPSARRRASPPRLMAAGDRARCGDHLINATTGSWMQVARGSP